MLMLGTGIVLLPQRNPVVLAKELGSLDVLSGGRLLALLAVPAKLCPGHCFQTSCGEGVLASLADPKRSRAYPRKRVFSRLEEPHVACM